MWRSRAAAWASARSIAARFAAGCSAMCWVTSMSASSSRKWKTRSGPGRTDPGLFRSQRHLAPAARAQQRGIDGDQAGQHLGDARAQALEVRARRDALLVQIKRAIDLDLQRMHAA